MMAEMGIRAYFGWADYFRQRADDRSAMVAKTPEQIRALLELHRPHG